MATFNGVTVVCMLETGNGEFLRCTIDKKVQLRAEPIITRMKIGPDFIVNGFGGEMSITSVSASLRDYTMQTTLVRQCVDNLNIVKTIRTNAKDEKGIDAHCLKIAKQLHAWLDM